MSIEQSQEALDLLYETLGPLRKQVAELEIQEQSLLFALISAQIRTLVPTAVSAAFEADLYENGWFFTEDPILTLADGTRGALSELGDGTTVDSEITGSLSGTYGYTHDWGIELDVQQGVVKDTDA